MSERLHPSEDPSLFSLRRAKHGAKFGTVTGIGIATPILAFTAISMGISEPEYLVGHFNEFLVVGTALEAGLSIPLGITGALINGFRPTSKILERKIKQEIGTLRDIKDSIQEVWSYMRQPDLAERLTQNRGEIAKKLVLFGGLVLVSIFGLKQLKDLYKPGMENLISEVFENPSNFPIYLTEHPVEIAIIVGASFTYVGIREFLRMRTSKKSNQDTQKDL